MKSRLFTPALLWRRDNSEAAQSGIGHAQGVLHTFDGLTCSQRKAGAVFIPTLRVSGAKRAPHLPRQGARPRVSYIAFGSLLSRFGVT